MSDAIGTQADGQLVWGRFEDEGVALYTANADGTGVRPLLPPGTYSEQPHWSPDGSRIAMMAVDHHRGVGALVNADGSDLQVFSRQPGAPNLACVTWSPDASRLACEGFDVRGLDGAYTVSATDGTDLRRLTKERDVPCAWSPDGSTLLVSRIRPQDADHSNLLLTMSADGTDARPLTDGVGCGDWAPDGESILTVKDGALLELSLDGDSTPIPVDGVVTSAAYSPDGTCIVLSMHPGDHRTDIFTMRRDGSGVVQVTDTPEDEEFADWAA